MFHGNAEVEYSMVGKKHRGKRLVSLRNRVFSGYILLHWSQEAGQRILGINLIQSPKYFDDRYDLFMQCLQLFSCEGIIQYLPLLHWSAAVANYSVYMYIQHTYNCSYICHELQLFQLEKKPLKDYLVSLKVCQMLLLHH